MNDGEINIKFFSDSYEDFYSFSHEFKKLIADNINLNLFKLENFTINNDEIIVIQINSLESEILKNLIANGKHVKNQIIFILHENDGLLASFLAKNDFLNIFVLPQELKQVLDFIKLIINKKEYLTSIDFTENTENSSNSFDDIIGSSNEIKKMIEFSKKAAENRNLNILILGETGTGKDLLARAIHKHNDIKTSPFIDIICTAIPEHLMESELFGYEKGAFTNAINQKMGLFEAADGGTLFLDEIGDLSLKIQTKLLRVIDRKIIRRLGGIVDIPVCSRIISATNRDLELMIEANMFRRDLYHRLNVISIELPPLRLRTEDILPITYHFIDKFNRMFGKQVQVLDNELQEFVLNYSWPGNIRELKNTIERAILLCDDSKLKLKDFLEFNNVTNNLSLLQENSQLFPHLIKIDLNYKKNNLNNLIKIYAKEVLLKAGGNKSKTAILLGISRPKLNSLLK